MNLIEGWNLVSLLVDKTSSTNTLGDFKIIWTFENNKWVENPEIIKVGQGFWINMNSENSILFDGENYATDLINLNDGWNLLGTGKKLSNIKESFNFNLIWTFENNKWIKNPDSIQAGEGFWLKK